MKSTIILAAFVTFSLLFTSCKEQESTASSQMETVIAVHDELMPKMTEIGVLRQKLMDAVPDSTATEAQNKVILDLKEANAAMMQWMKDFGADFDFEEIAQGKPLDKDKKDLLDTYQKSVNDLKKQMLSSLENGQTLFDSLKE